MINTTTIDERMLSRTTTGQQEWLYNYLSSVEDDEGLLSLDLYSIEDSKAIRLEVNYDCSYYQYIIDLDGVALKKERDSAS